jgi:hypothetical protein
MAQSENLFAENIIHQLGGNRFIAMTGANNLYFDNQKRLVSMQIMRNKAKAKWLQITLNGADLYDMKFLGIKSGDLVVLEEKTMIYHDMLQSVFTSVTGLNTHL